MIGKFDNIPPSTNLAVEGGSGSSKSAHSFFIFSSVQGISFIKYDYFNTGVIAEENAGTYADRTAPIKMKEYGWNHPFSEIIGALIDHGLKVLHLHEFPFSPVNCFNDLEPGEDGYWHIKGMNDRLPMMYSIKAIKE